MCSVADDLSAGGVSVIDWARPTGLNGLAALVYARLMCNRHGSPLIGYVL